MRLRSTPRFPCQFTHLVSLPCLPDLQNRIRLLLEPFCYIMARHVRVATDTELLHLLELAFSKDAVYHRTVDTRASSYEPPADARKTRREGLRCVRRESARYLIAHASLSSSVPRDVSLLNTPPLSLSVLKTATARILPCR